MVVLRIYYGVAAAIWIYYRVVVVLRIYYGAVVALRIYYGVAAALRIYYRVVVALRIYYGVAVALRICYGAVVALSATDDITFIRCEKAKINQVERVLPRMLSEEGLYINKSKTEKYHISKCSNTKWKSCKYLGSLIGTEEDIKRRKGLTHDNYHALESILKSKLVSEPVRIRIFRAYIESIFLYNSELWTLTNTLERSIDSFHWRLLRKVIHVTWPRVITNEELYKRTKVTPWSLIICKRRLSWFGHLLRLPSETPAERSLKVFVKTWKRSTGRPKTTWLSLILSDIFKYSNINLSEDQEKDLESLEKICDDRKARIKTVDCIMSSKKTKMQ